MDYEQCENDRKNIAYAKQTLHDIFEAAGAQDVLEIDRYAHLVGGCRMGSDPRAAASSTPIIESGMSLTCSSPTAASCPPRARPIRR